MAEEAEICDLIEHASRKLRDDGEDEAADILTRCRVEWIELLWGIERKTGYEYFAVDVAVVVHDPLLQWIQEDRSTCIPLIEEAIIKCSSRKARVNEVKWWSLEKYMRWKSGEKDIEESKETEFCASPDYHSVLFKGKVYSFGAMQAKAIQILHESFKNGTPEVGQAYVLEKVESKSDNLRDLFKKSDAWRTLIVAGDTQGNFRLNI
jgi:hypothetical protein